MFRTLSYLMCVAKSKPYQTSKTMRHIGNPGIVRTVYSDPFRHTQGHSAIFSDVHVTAQKMTFSIKDFSVNVTKSTFSSEFGHIY